MDVSTVLLAALTFVLGIYFPVYLGKIITYFETRKIIKEITPKEATKDKLCKETHTWMTARTWTEKGPGNTLICRACGLISGTNKLASAEALDRIEENNRIMEIEDRFHKDFLTKEDDEIKKYMDEEIKSGLSFEKLTTIHAAGMTFNQRFHLYRTSRVGEIDKELKRNNA